MGSAELGFFGESKGDRLNKYEIKTFSIQIVFD